MSMPLNADGYPLITPLDIVPYLIILLALYIAVREVRRGLRTGTMVWYRRGAGSGDETVEDSPPNISQRDEQPKTFWSLFVFYCLIIVLAPIMTAASLLTKAGIIEWPYN